MAAVSAEAARRWQRRADVLWRESLGSVVLLPAGADEPFVVPSPAAVLWEALSVPQRPDELLAVLDDAGLGETVAAGLLDDLLAELADRGALDAVGDPA